MAEVVAPRSRRTESVRPATSLPRSLMSRFSTGHLVMIVAGLLGLLLTFLLFFWVNDGHFLDCFRKTVVHENRGAIYGIVLSRFIRVGNSVKS